jgi:predicted metalloprotease
MVRRKAWSAAAAGVAALAAALTLAACGGDSSTGTSSSTTTSSTATTSSTTVEETTSSSTTEDVSLEGAAEELPSIQRNLGPHGYRSLLEGSLAYLDQYWHEQVPQLGGDYSPPAILRSYWTKAQDPGCGGQPLGMDNAEFCQPNNSISWDGNWMLDGFYDKVGDDAVTFVIAHEYGHLVQDRIGTFGTFDHQIEEELNADCLAGAFFGDINNNVVRLTKSDERSLYEGIFDVSDPRGLPWQNPQAHGTARQRDEALDIGLKNGPETCVKRLHPGFLGK